MGRHFETVWLHRRFVWRAAAISCGLCAIWLLGVSVWTPAVRVSSIQFRVLFDGAAEGRYPNGAPFSPAEIIGTPVVAEVFAANNLNVFGDYEDFKETLFIQPSNPELTLLAMEYQTRLSDAKLTNVERSGLEEEFKRRRASIADPVFTLSMRRGGRSEILSRDLAREVLADTVNTWAEQAERRKGAMNYQVRVFSVRALSRDALDTEDYFVAADLLRTQANRIIATIDELEALPGALTIRTAKDGLSLPEIRAGIEDAVRFELEPLLGVIRSEGVTRNARLLSIYASNQLFQFRLDKQVAEGRARAIQDSLLGYRTPRAAGGSLGEDQGGLGAGDQRGGGVDAPALIPQIGESFLDRLIEISGRAQSRDMAYRQALTDEIIYERTRIAEINREIAFYEDFARAIAGGARGAGSSPESVAFVEGRSRRVFDQIERYTGQLAELYLDLSGQNLMPEARLFAITEPFSESTMTTRSIRTVALWFALALMLPLIAVPAALIARDGARTRWGIQPGRPTQDRV